ncbi:hypothetical protein OIU78_028358 [Salix suchowensis]|nr:hypothetical protein OIU78_028358 [Salix suchowensis]
MATKSLAKKLRIGQSSETQLTVRLLKLIDLPACYNEKQLRKQWRERSLVSFNESGGVGGDKLNGEVQWWLEKLEKERVHSDYCESVGRE